MNEKNDILELLKHRYHMYRFLSRLYFLEVDEKLLEQLMELEFPVNTDIEELREGYQYLQEYLQAFANGGKVTEKLENLAVDYADVFLAAGVAQGLAAFPYESVYTSKKKLLMQEASEQVYMIYAEKGLVLGEGFPKVPNDHIAVELEFMAFLCEDAIAAVNQKKEEEFQKIMSSQRKFLKEHLLNWVPIFCQDMYQYSKTLFYQGVSKVTVGFIRWEENHGLQS